MSRDVFLRIAQALERLAPPPADLPDLSKTHSYIWQCAPDMLVPVSRVNRVDLALLVGIDQARDTLLANTRQFAKGFSANNALLWGARGMGKSSLIKSVHGALIEEGYKLKLVELLREDLASVGRLMEVLSTANERILIFCDDLSFSHDDVHYKSLKAILDGGIAGRPEHVLFYATSNRRHLMPRDMIENERSTAISPSEAVEEKISLSDRFGLWLGFHPCSQEDYLAMVEGYCRAYGVVLEKDVWQAEALAWQVTRGNRSGRVAWQFVCDLAGRQGIGLH